MRRSNSGLATRLTAHPRRAVEAPHVQRSGEVWTRRQKSLSRITVLPVIMARSFPDVAVNTDRLISSTAFVRAAAAIPARALSKRSLESSEADVLLLDARDCRSSVAYRAIARIRRMGWEQGVVLLVDPTDLAMVPVASSVGATDFVLSTTSSAEIDMRLRRAASSTSSPEGRRVGPEPEGIQVNWRTHQVSFEGTTISASLRELQLLSVLLDRVGEVVTSSDIARLAWGKRQRAASALAMTYVCSLRKKLAWFGGRFGIQTVRGVGYRLVV